jgi:protein O-GlcNAc transferase
MWHADAGTAMNLLRFQNSLSGLFQGWGTASAKPTSNRFERVLREIGGMTTKGVLQLLNLAVECLEPGECYCEVGSYRGATLAGALLGHSGVSAHAVDNFSEFDRENNNKDVLAANLRRFEIDKQVTFHHLDFEAFFLNVRSTTLRLGVYLYDGAHDYRSQLLGLLLAVPVLAERALLVVDDSNWPEVKQACWDFMAVYPQCRLLYDLATPGNCHPSFWNGLYVMAWEASAVNGYTHQQLGEKRQADLLDTLKRIQHQGMPDKTEKVPSR